MKQNYSVTDVDLQRQFSTGNNKIPIPVPSVKLQRKIDITSSPAKIPKQKKYFEICLKELQNKLEELETSPVITRPIIGSLRHF